MTVPAPEPAPSSLTQEEAAALAARHGLRRVDRQPTLREYLGQLLRHRAFIWELASANAYSRNQNNYLGQLWAGLNPLLMAGSYYLIFGLLLRTRDGVDNYVGFLVIGIFLFTFFSATLTSGSRAILNNQGMIRALRFPRASLPLSISISEILALLPALVVMTVVLLFTGERPSWTWLLMPFAVALLFAFSTGTALIAARIGSDSRDVLNFIPMGVRLLRYVSGVFFSIETYAGGTIGFVLQYQPVAVYLSLVRTCMLEESEQDPTLWAAAIGWAVLALVGGLILFWRAERRYGRD